MDLDLLHPASETVWFIKRGPHMTRVQGKQASGQGSGAGRCYGWASRDWRLVLLKMGTLAGLLQVSEEVL